MGHGFLTYICDLNGSPREKEKREKDISELRDLVSITKSFVHLCLSGNSCVEVLTFVKELRVAFIRQE